MSMMALALMAAVVSPAAHEQVDAHPPTSAAQTDLPADDILVYAQRRAQQADEVPIALDAIDGKALAQLPVRDLQDLQRYVPSLQTSQVTRDDAFIVIRGQGPGVGAFPGVLTYFNEVPFRGLGEGFYYDLSGVEILKGPQGTLFGRNSNGGAILFKSARPEPTFGGYVQGQLGTFDDRQVQGAVNLPIDSDRLMLRVAGTIGVRDGFTRTVSGRQLDDRDFAGARVSLRWEPVAGIRNDIVADYTRISTNGTSAILNALNPASPLALLPAQLSGAAFALLAQQRALGVRTQAGTGTDTTRRARQWGVQHRLEIDLGPNTVLTNIAAYRRYQLLFRADYDGTPLPLLDFSITPDGRTTDDEQYSEELQLRGTAGKLRYTLGGYLQRNQPAGTQRQIGVVFFQPILQTNDADDLSRAVYGQLEYDADALLRGLRLTAGGRYTWDRRRQSAVTQNLVTGACSGFGATPPGCDLSDTARFDAPSWSLSAAWQVQPRTMVYLASRRGYKSGGLNLGQPFAAARAYAPEYLTDVELGVKTTVPIGGASLHLDAAAFRGKYTDVQVNALVADPARSAIYNIVENSASATLQGIELDTSLRLPAGVRLGVSYAYTDAQYDRFISTIYGDLSGQPWPYTARHRASLSAAWDVPVPAAWGVPTLGAHLNAQSRSTFGYDPDPTTGEAGYGLLDLSLDWAGVAGGPVDVGLFVSNATDKTYRTGVIGLFNSLGLSSSVYGAPRMAGLRLRVGWGEGS